MASAKVKKTAKMGYGGTAAAADDGHPQQAVESHSQATEDMPEVSEAVGSEQAVALDGPTAIPTPEPEPNHTVTGGPGGATKNVSFNLLPSGCNDSDSDDDDAGGNAGDFISSVRVAVRIRPFLPLETGTSGVIDVLPSTATNASSAGGHKRKRRQQQQQPKGSTSISWRAWSPESALLCQELEPTPTGRVYLQTLSPPTTRASSSFSTVA
mmetsp:Transcript_13692/g.39252  ORF Transcript_13692/g.39252 Transcript_13692/m.39252 type:complete len:211 (-) Transcript_13692:1582-2214(-)